MKKGPMIILLIAIPVIVGVLVFAALKLGWFSGGDKKAEKEPEKPAKEYTYSIGEFTVNLNEPNYKRYMKVSVYAGYTDKELETALPEILPQMSDMINEVLRGKKLEDVNAPEKTDAVKKEIRDKINGILTEGKLTNIYFNQILIQ